jgi:hypothetical protein
MDGVVSVARYAIIVRFVRICLIRSADRRRSRRAWESAVPITNAGQMPSSRKPGCSRCTRPGCRRDCLDDRNSRPESRMRENRTYGSEGGEARAFPTLYTGIPQDFFLRDLRRAHGRSGRRGFLKHIKWERISRLQNEILYGELLRYFWSGVSTNGQSARKPD